MNPEEVKNNTGLNQEYLPKQIDFKIRRLCKKHKSEIGGICNEINCQTQTQMKCALCVCDENCCVRKYDHKYIPIDEFVNTVFGKYYADLKTNFNTCTEVNRSESFCFCTEQYLNQFAEKKNKILESFDILCKQLNDHIEKAKSEFRQFLVDSLEKREYELKETFYALNSTLNYDALDQFDLRKLSLHMNKMPYDSIDSSLLKMKMLISNLRNKYHIELNNKIDKLLCVNHDDYIRLLGENFDDIYTNLNSFFDCFKGAIGEILFKQEIKVPKTLKPLKQIYDKHIDFTANSNFCDKKFTIYKSIVNNKTYLAYPTTLNNIKIEDFTDNVKTLEEKKEYTSNSILHYNMDPNGRDYLLYFKLKGHESRINNILYFGHELSKREFLITTAGDLKIKIWDITNIHNYLNNVDDYYKNEDNVKNLIAHKGIVKDLSIYYHPTISLTEKEVNSKTIDTAIPYLISISNEEKIQVWNILTGENLFEFYDRNSLYKGTFESVARGFYSNNKNYLATASNSQHCVKIWDFDKKEVLHALKCLDFKVNIIEIIYCPKKNSLIFVDDKGTCSICKIVEDVEPLLINMNIDCYKTERIGAMLFEDNTLLFYCLNGGLYLFDLNLTRYIDKRRICEKKITHLICLDDKENDRKLVCLHIINQKLQIYG